MKVSQFMVDRFIVTSCRPFETVVAGFERMIGHPDISEFQSAIGASKRYAEMEAVIQKELGKSGFLELGR